MLSGTVAIGSGVGVPAFHQREEVVDAVSTVDDVVGEVGAIVAEAQVDDDD